MSNWKAGAGTHTASHPERRARVYTGARPLPVGRAHNISVQNAFAIMLWLRRQLDGDFSADMGGNGAVNDLYRGPPVQLSSPGCRLVPGTVCSSATGAVAAATPRAPAG